MAKRVTASELYEHWMGDDAIGMVDDTSREMRVVTMQDGTQYECSFDDVVRHQTGLKN